MIYYSAIKFEAILRDDNWKQGGNAHFFYGDNVELVPRFETRVYGKTKAEAEQKALKFLGKEVECVGELPPSIQH